MTGPIHTTGTWPTAVSGPYPLPGSHVQQTPAPAERRGKTWLWTTVIIAAIAFTGLCAGLGAALASRHPNTPAAAPVTTVPVTDAERHQQDVNLCTAYAIADAAIPLPLEHGNDLLPARLTLLRALDDNPEASTEIRSALKAAAEAYLTQAGTASRSRGLAEIPAFAESDVAATKERAWHLCGLGK